MNLETFTVRINIHRSNIIYIRLLSYEHKGSIQYDIILLYCSNYVLYLGHIQWIELLL